MKMKNKTTLFWVCFFSVLSPLLAQVKINLDDQRIKVYLPQYEIVEVVDARSDGAYIGSLRTRSRNTAELVAFDRPFEQAILGMVEDLNEDAERQPLILQFNAFKIYEFSYYDRVFAYVELNIDFLTEIDGQYYSLFESAVLKNRQSTHASGELLVIKYLEPLGVNSHLFNIRAAIKESLESFIMRLENDELTRIPVEIGIPQTRSYPIQTADFVPRGLFMTFDDFRDNIVTEIEFQSSLLRSSWGEKYNRARLKITDKGFTSKNDIWGFSDGENCFIRVGADFHRIHWQQDTALVKITAHESKPLEGTLLFNNGWAITVINDPAAERSARYRGSTNNMSNQEDWQINMLTGSLMPYGTARLANVVFYNSKFNNKAAKAVIKRGDKELCTLPRNTAFWYQSEEVTQEMEICVVIEDEMQCKRFVPDFNEMQVYEVKYHKKKGIVFDRVIKNARIGMIKDIKTNDIEVILKYREQLEARK